MEHLTPQLRQLGFTGHEAAIYAALLESSPASATFIAKKCRLSRSSVYTTLSTLIAKGLVGTTFKNEVKQFIAEDASAVERMLKQEKEKIDEKWKMFESLRGSLQSFGKGGMHVPQIVFFEGQEGLKKIYLSMMRQAEMGSVLYLLRDEFVWQPEWKFIFEQEWHDRVKRIKIEKNITTKLLLNPSKTEKAQAAMYDGKKNLSYRFLSPKHLIHQFAIYIIDDVVSVLSMEKNNLVGIKMTNRHLADNFKEMFEGLWEKAK